MSANPRQMPETAQAAHPLFRTEQVFLWLPGLAGDHLPYCTYNEMTGDDLEPHHDENHAFYSPPFPVSRETYISWDTQVSPPFPYHAVPIPHSLSPRQMEDLARRVIALMDASPEDFPDPLRVLTNPHKNHIYLALAEMRIPARFVLAVVH